MRERLVSAFDEFVDVRASSDAEVAVLSRQLGIDIAVDLKGLTRDCRPGIFACRAAALQVSYLGYPGTMAAPYMDYIVADHTVIPPAIRDTYSESVAYLPHSYQVNDAKRKVAVTSYSRANLGLPADGFVFCCFNNAYKLNPEMFDCWVRILERVDGSVLWLLSNSPAAAANLRREARRRGIDGKRIVLAKRIEPAEHLARHRVADLFLDTLPYNAHTTASDALWSCVPIVTRIGDSFPARVAASLLRAVGLSELVTATTQEYEDLAVHLATHPGNLAALRARLEAARNAAPLFDTSLFARDLESAFVRMCERYQSGLAPADFDIR